MADPIRLFAEFTDQLGTDYKLNIHESGYGGSATEFNLGIRWLCIALQR